VKLVIIKALMTKMLLGNLENGHHQGLDDQNAPWKL